MGMFSSSRRNAYVPPANPNRSTLLTSGDPDSDTPSDADPSDDGTTADGAQLAQARPAQATSQSPKSLEGNDERRRQRDPRLLFQTSDMYGPGDLNSGRRVAAPVPTNQNSFNPRRYSHDMQEDP